MDEELANKRRAYNVKMHMLGSMTEIREDGCLVVLDVKGNNIDIPGIATDILSSCFVNFNRSDEGQVSLSGCRGLSGNNVSQLLNIVKKFKVSKIYIDSDVLMDAVKVIAEIVGYELWLVVDTDKISSQSAYGFLSRTNTAIGKRVTRHVDGIKKLWEMYEKHAFGMLYKNSRDVCKEVAAAVIRRNRSIPEDKIYAARTMVVSEINSIYGKRADAAFLEGYNEYSVYVTGAVKEYTGHSFSFMDTLQSNYLFKRNIFWILDMYGSEDGLWLYEKLKGRMEEWLDSNTYESIGTLSIHIGDRFYNYEVLLCNGSDTMYIGGYRESDSGGVASYMEYRKFIAGISS